MPSKRVLKRCYTQLLKHYLTSALAASNYNSYFEVEHVGISQFIKKSGAQKWSKIRSKSSQNWPEIWPISENFEISIFMFSQALYPYPHHIEWNPAKLCGNVTLGKRSISLKFEQISLNLEGVPHAHKVGQFSKMTLLFIAPPPLYWKSGTVAVISDP